MQVTITTTNATTPIYVIVDTFANNTVSAQITDQSGDAVPNRGDSNANFDEPLPAGTPTSNQGMQQQTLLQQTGSVLIGPDGQPAAVGPTNNDDDYTNRSVNTGISGIAPGGTTNASGQIIFTNTVRNTGNANDTLRSPRRPCPRIHREISINGHELHDGQRWRQRQPARRLRRVRANSGARHSAVRQGVLTGFERSSRRLRPSHPRTRTGRLIALSGFIRLEKAATVNNTTASAARRTCSGRGDRLHDHLHQHRQYGRHEQLHVDDHQPRHHGGRQRRAE